jgi:hypothetical protein
MLDTEDTTDHSCGSSGYDAAHRRERATHQPARKRETWIARVCSTSTAPFAFSHFLVSERQQSRLNGFVQRKRELIVPNLT